MHYRVNERFRAVSMTFGSEYIKGRVLDTLEMAGWQQIELLLNSARNAGLLGKSLAKAIVEQYCWNRLLKQREPFEMRHLCGEGM